MACVSSALQWYATYGCPPAELEGPPIPNSPVPRGPAVFIPLIIKVAVTFQAGDSSIDIPVFPFEPRMVILAADSHSTRRTAYGIEGIKSNLERESSAKT
ncbi:hypothetical protein FRB94_001151 [Tulasnella sp. JGI-2019a]|nr:hypothetical protein FRB93_000892 [Tulasnella sp. JGI-2019a]KAG9005876.1 hypothetical protein FRB94_001151 [Tulasnella sp. JGI-2019a]KAG9026771.1 hypothetical protein FRB95_008500 [Tulasnella sp. JGI-2019a]